MARLSILSEPNEILRKRAKEVVEFDTRLHQLLDDMADTLKTAAGVGIAAPQVGVLFRACLVDAENDGIVELVNPVIIKTTGSKIGDEGCLSIPGKRGFVARPAHVTIRAQDRYGKFNTYEFNGRFAVCACHELDHLDGVLFIDKLAK